MSAAVGGIRSYLAAVHSQFGDPLSVCSLEQVAGSATQQLGPHDVACQVLAAPINHADLNRVEGSYPILPGSLPASCGSEGVARVIGAGPNVQLKPGDRVVPRVWGLGTWANELVAKDHELSPIPDETLDDIDASQVSVSPATAIRMLEDFEQLQPGEHSLVQNCANSAVGRSVIQLAESRGVPTVNFIRNREGADEVAEGLRELGATEVLFPGDEKSDAVHDRIRNQLPPAVLGLSAAGGEHCRTVAKLLARDGTLVVYGAADKSSMEINARQLLFRNISVRGFWLSNWYMNVSDNARQELLSQVCEEVQRGMVLPAHSFPLEAFSEALKAATGPRQGRKVVLTCR
jgi:trans-2-enoyl-CoA reductase